MLTLSAVTTTALQALARKQQLTLATLLNAAWTLLLSHYSGREEVLYGCFCAGRPPTLPGSEYIVGFFPNILPLRVQVPAEAQLISWLKQLQMQLVELREFDYTPLMSIKKWLGLPEEAPPFQSYLVVVEYPLFAYGGVGEKRARISPSVPWIPISHLLQRNIRSG
jgi:surfactin family lipopeptide synthetase C